MIIDMPDFDQGFHARRARRPRCPVATAPPAVHD